MSIGPGFIQQTQTELTISMILPAIILLVAIAVSIATSVRSGNASSSEQMTFFVKRRTDSAQLIFCESMVQ